MTRILGIVLAALLVPTTGALADVQGQVLTTGGPYAVRVKSMLERRVSDSFKTTIRQQFDFSCGSAAIATLLTFHYRNPVDEQTAFRLMFETGDQQRIQKEGFSLLDMKRFLGSIGYQADGFEVTIDELRDAKVPAIALIRENGYNHFVVVKGVDRETLLIGDPSVGTRTMRREVFEAMWVARLFFVIRSHQEHAKFNDQQHWTFRLQGPVADSVLADASAVPMLMRPGRNEF